MTIAPWCEDYKTGHATIDSQHQHLFELVNQIHNAALKATPCRRTIRTMLKEFEACALEHFALEEELMLAQEYQNYELHCGIHRNLIRKVSSTLEKLESDDYEFSTEVPKVLSDWMIHHIRGEDRQMIAFLQEQTCLGQLA